MCTPVEAVAERLRPGRTTLLQTAFGVLSDRVESVDVGLPGVPMFRQVLVSPIGQVPLDAYTSDLQRPVSRGAAQGVSPTKRFSSMAAVIDPPLRPFPRFFMSAIGLSMCLS